MAETRAPVRICRRLLAGALVSTVILFALSLVAGSYTGLNLYQPHAAILMKKYFSMPFLQKSPSEVSKATATVAGPGVEEKFAAQRPSLLLQAGWTDALAEVVYFPPLTDVVGIAACLFGLLSILSSSSPQASDPSVVIANRYSKFFQGDESTSVPSQRGMFFLYFPAIFAWPLVASFAGGLTTPYYALGCTLVSLHFTKRVLEVLFVHRYSGRMDKQMVTIVSIYYFLLATLLACTSHFSVPVEVASTALAPFDNLGLLGVGLYAVGIVGNLYHHILLRNLREPGEKTYKAPTGGLFSFVACPHYFLEVVQFLGLALILRHPYAYLVPVDMLLRLSGRAQRTVDWYKERNIPVPQGWRKIIPFLY